MCKRDPQEWKRVHAALSELMDRADELIVRAKHARQSRVWVDARWVFWQLHDLMRDLYMWDPNESVCYGEFWSRIRRLRKTLDRLEQQLQVKAKAG